MTTLQNRGAFCFSNVMLKTLMQNKRIMSTEYIYISGIIGHILLGLTSQRYQKYSIILGFHRRARGGHWISQMFPCHKSCHFNGICYNGTAG